MSDYALLKELLPYMAQFEAESGGGVWDFCQFLRRKLMFDEQTPSVSPDFTQSENHLPERFPEVEFATLLTGLYRFGRHYVKKALAQTGINTLEEFGFLASLIRKPGLLKSELIQLHLMEISSGTEVIKRLIRSEMMEELPDPDDRRAKRLHLTLKGRNTIMAAFFEMYKASRIIRGNLSDEELAETTSVMEKLSVFHWHIHEKDKLSGIEQLLEKYINN